MLAIKFKDQNIHCYAGSHKMAIRLHSLCSAMWNQKSSTQQVSNFLKFSSAFFELLNFMWSALLFEFVGIHVRLNWMFPPLTSFNPSWFSEPLRIKRGVCEIRKRRYSHSYNFFVTLCMSVSHFSLAGRVFLLASRAELSCCCMPVQLWLLYSQVSKPD